MAATSAGTPSDNRPPVSAPGPLRVLVVDDHALVRSGVRSELTAHAPDLDVVAEAEDVEGAIAEDRHGVRESIIARMERHGGSARVRRMATGTEVTLSLPT